MIRTSSWLVDNGASSHICSDRSLFSSLQQPTDDIIVRFGGGETYKVLGVGTVVATLCSQTSETTIQLDNVLFLPSSVHNLLSVRALGAAGIAVSFPIAGRVELKTDAVHIGEGFTRKSLFYLQLHHGSSAAPPINPTACPVSTTTSSYLWHRRFGHLNMRDLSTLHRQQLVTGLNLSSSSIPQCISCYRGKQTRQPFGVSHSRTTAPLQLIHSDIAGPFSYGTTIGGARYLLTFIDDYSRHITVYLLRHRSEAFSCFKDYVTQVHNMHSPRTIKAFLSDGALEFNSDAFTSFLKAHGIARHRSTPYTPEKNGVAECANRTILEMVRSMLHDAHMDKGWWEAADKYRKWEKADAAIISVLIGTTPPELVNTYHNYSTSNAIWKHLQDRFMNKTAVRVAILIRTMFQEDAPYPLGERPHLHQGLFALLSAKKDTTSQAKAYALRAPVPQASVASVAVQRNRFPPCTYVKYGNRKGQVCGGTNS
ncbi:unnamed protein product [Closterium sp. NIES-54]